MSEFELLLKDVVQAKRLSASKMTKLTEVAMKSMQNDTQMVSTLYRMHKSLPKAFKISSLYVFDALAREAKRQVSKQGLSLDVSGQSGNAATFLSKLGGVVEGLYQDMLASDIPESKAKSKKVLDIWVKGSTFPADQLARLSDLVEGRKKEPETNSPFNITPPAPEIVSQSTPPAATTPPNFQEQNPQAALLALLAQAANTASLQTNVNTPPVAPLAPAQLAVLQQLTLTAANVAPTVPNVSLHTLTSAPHGNDYGPGPNRSSRSPIPDDPRRASIRDDSRRERHFSPEAGRPHDNRPDHRSFSRDPRTNPRGNTRGRGWGERRWEDRDYPNRERDRDYRRRSRSKSPPSRFGEKRAEHRLSPRRDAPTSNSWPNPIQPNLAPGKDEFGRDIRAPTPEANSETTIIQPPTGTLPNATPTDGIDQENSSTTSTSNKNVPAPVAPITSSDASFEPNTNSSQLGMDTFDFSTFDLRSPASWEALGKMWLVTYRCAPTDEQLMQFVMSLSMGVAAGGQAAAQASTDGEQGQWQMGDQGGRKGGWGSTERSTNGYMSRGRGRGGAYGNGRDNQQSWGYNDYSSNNGTDAIVLGGGDPNEEDRNGYSNMPIDTYTSSLTGSSEGETKKAGDQWSSVRSNESIP